MESRKEYLETEIFLRVKRVIIAQPNQSLKIADLADVHTKSPLKERIEEIKIKEVTKKDGQSMIITALEIISAIKNKFPDSHIEHLGEADIIIDIKSSSKKAAISKQPSRLYILAVGIILFFGSGMAIMNFHADVNMAAVHQQIYYLIMGKFQNRPLLLQIPYSIGLGSGMVIFFNQIYKHKFNKEDPSPLDIEMYLYKNKVNQFSLHRKTEIARRDKKNRKH